MAVGRTELPPRLIGLFHLCSGAVLVARPGAVTRVLRDSTPPRRWVIQLLGTRSLLQGAVTSAVPDAPIVAVGAMVDGLHAASMIAAAAAWPAHRRAAVLSAVVAAVCCVGGAAAARLTRPQHAPGSIR